MKQLLQQYAAYNVWANNKLFERISLLTEEQIHQEVPNSFPSLYKTVLHLLDAESIWWQRLKLAEFVEVPSKNFTGNFSELVKQSQQQSLQWKEWVDAAGENQLQHVFAYQNSKKEQFKQPVTEVLMHMFNHGTYHRGQIVTIFHQLGVDKIPGTDFILYTRTKK
ncbi:DinB family protein [Ferruginibacter sp. SUN002]|uniref:DinB family protein n=1 Tax=Ferruginibacter sp. SUN002 TaxID=2937789 RepID=UPI003D36AF6A